jgi:2-polyprenyl-6-methoxyphenol hydroxylase-like FAD-dependent oxidoreductase
VQPVYSGYFIWRGAPNEGDLSPSTRETMFPYYSFFLGDQLQALGYPISGADDELRIGHRRYNFAWYRVADTARLKQMCTDENGRQYEFGVPPPLVRKDLITEMRNEAETLLPPQYLDCLRHVEQPFFTPVYDFCSPSLVFGRVALVGDAASTPRSHIGFGVAKAGAEAQALAEALSHYDDIDRALLAYNSARQPLSKRIVSHSRKLGMQLGIGIETDADRRLAATLRTPRGIMDWIAVPNFLEMRQ